MTKEMTNPQQVENWLRQIEVGEGMHHHNLTIFPLFRRHTAPESEADREIAQSDSDGGRYRLLDDAVKLNEAVVEEVSEGGDVPFLGVKNVGAKPILIPEGEILTGAKQNRVVNLTVLVASQSTCKLPVSCVEQGRWHYKTRHFRPTAFAHPILRDMKVRSAQRNRKVMGMALADQGGVWDEVDSHLDAFAAAAPTRDIIDGFVAAEDLLGGYQKEIDLPGDACGFVAASGENVMGLDLFDEPQTMRKLWSRMSDAYFIEAARDRSKTPKTPRAVAESFLGEVAQHLVQAETQPDLGLELEVAEDRLSGSALYYEGAVCHLSAFESGGVGG